MSKIQYSMLPYAVTSKIERNKLQTMQNKTLKGILKISHLTSTKLVHVLANTEPLNQRIKTLIIKYISNARVNNINSITTLINNFTPYMGQRNYTIIDSLYPNMERH